MGLKLTTSYLEDSLTLFRFYKALAEGAMSQVTDEQLVATLDDEMNSIAILMKHLAGNMRSRWTDFLTSDGEKPSRDRDSEFVDAPKTRAELLSTWDQGWACLFATLESLRDADLARRVTIRGEVHSILQAISRALTHAAYHVGQIVFLAKHFKGKDWQTLSVPRNKSAAFTRRVSSQAIQR